MGFSVLATKAYALMVGPQGVGAFALMLAVLNLSVIVASLGVQASTTTLVANTASRLGRAAALEQAGIAMLFAAAVGALGALVLLLLRDPLAVLVLGDQARAGDVLYIALALMLTVIATVGAATLVGLHHLMAATAAAIITATSALVVGIGLVGLLGVGGLAPTIASVAGVQLLVTSLALRRAGLSLAPGGVSRHWQTIRSLVSLGVPVAFGQLLTGGALLLVPVIVLQSLGHADVGYYRAAGAISAGLGAIFIAGIHQDFLPRMAGSHSAEHLKLIESRLRIVVGISLPMILLLLGLGPFVLDLLYTVDFRPSLAVLQWQLVGDIVRLPAMVMVTAVLAVRSRTAYLALEALSGIAIIGGTVLGIALAGLAGAGIAYAVAQLATFAAGLAVVRWRFGALPGQPQAVTLVMVLGCATFLLLDPDASLRMLILVPAAGLIALVSWFRLRSLARAEGKEEAATACRA